MNVFVEALSPPRLRSWKVLLVVSTVYVLGTLAFGVIGLTSIDGDQGHAAGFAAMALLALMAISVVAYAVALVAVVLLRREIATAVVGVVLAGGGLAVYVLSGGFVGFLPLALLGVVVGGLAIWESD